MSIFDHMSKFVHVGVRYSWVICFSFVLRVNTCLSSSETDKSCRVSTQNKVDNKLNSILESLPPERKYTLAFIPEKIGPLKYDLIINTSINGRVITSELECNSMYTDITKLGCTKEDKYQYKSIRVDGQSIDYKSNFSKSKCLKYFVLPTGEIKTDLTSNQASSDWKGRLSKIFQLILPEKSNELSIGYKWNIILDSDKKTERSQGILHYFLTEILDNNLGVILWSYQDPDENHGFKVNGEYTVDMNTGTIHKLTATVEHIKFSGVDKPASIYIRKILNVGNTSEKTDKKKV